MTSTLDFIIIILTSLYCMGLFLLFIGLFFPNRRQHGDKPHVSVIIAARNEEKNIKNVLADLLNQTYPENRVEIVIVNDHSEDSTEEIIQAISRKNRRIKYLHITQIEEKLTAKKNALFQGIQNSRGEIILTTDADCKVLPTWVETMVSYFSEDVGMVVGFSQLCYGDESCSLFQKIQAVDFLMLMAAAQGTANMGCAWAASGQNLAYRKTVYDQV
ncbi:glycosyltransferase, partial [bacterium]|nr:glycosyltransferase [bacterium]